MKNYRRDFPEFAACGLNCGLCTRYHTDGTSRCPGCYGEGFNLKHPSCGIVSCTERHDVQFCYACAEYPCKRYEAPSESDSFITGKNVFADFEKAKTFGLDTYKAELDEKISILRRLLSEYNDGRKKSFYCTAVNLLPLADIKEIMETLQADFGGLETDMKVKSARAAALLEEQAKKRDIKIELRRKKK